MVDWSFVVVVVVVLHASRQKSQDWRKRVRICLVYLRYYCKSL